MEENKKIVHDLVKLDLHIHSVYSKKDKDLVSKNTIQNIPILMEKLEQEKVNMIAITDHNAFSYDMYKAMKSNMSKCKTLLKVLPGVEFDVEISDNRVHVISIFDDAQEDKIAKIEGIVTKYQFDNKNDNAFKKSTFKEILSKIDLNVVIIAHQKCSPKASKQDVNLSSIGEEEFDKIIDYDYFDAVEFRSGKVEGILNNYREEKDLRNLRYITGTDCHDWTVYPAQKSSDKSQMKYTYMKSLPSFRGLAMALTEPNRLSTAYSSINAPYVKEIKIETNGKEEVIELSSGINVVIGDNSVGKSLLFEYLYSSDLKDVKPASKVNGYKQFCKKKKIKITPFESEMKNGIKFDRQGDIRDLFQRKSNLKDIAFFTDKFKELKTDIYNEELDAYINNVIKLIEFNQEKKTKLLDLDYSLEIPAEIDDVSYSLRVIPDLTYTAKDYAKVISTIELAKNSISKLKNEKLLKDEDKKYLSSVEQNLVKMIKKYNNLKFQEKVTETIIATINSVTESFDNEAAKTAEAQENKINAFKKNISNFTSKIIGMIETDNKKNPTVLENFKTINIEEADNPFGKYHFVTRVVTSNITKDIIEKALMYPFSHKGKISYLENIDLDNFDENCNAKIDPFKKEGKDIKTSYKECVKEYIGKNILKIENVILLDKDDISTGNSPGKNALIYLDIFSKDSTIKLYLVDQPGDDVSQNRISTDLISILRKMVEFKQVLFITHKPELVVNLDVDNVIVLKNDENNNLKVSYGALEYIDDEVNILDEVANTLDGGVEVIRKRWKRYDK